MNLIGLTAVREAIPKVACARCTPQRTPTTPMMWSLIGVPVGCCICGIQELARNVLHIGAENCARRFKIELLGPFDYSNFFSISTIRTIARWDQYKKNTLPAFKNAKLQKQFKDSTMQQHRTRPHSIHNIHYNFNQLINK